ncbi:predicted protein [Sclerotinia sclerotiorum 1980 UF-70]|uniref:Uncharacterized protein n=2 Tax=Sclerotinia sclerotiorum (strain ATCC 18683 / 1980 / Ss-1) TaxID=665079 RepID=A7F7W6_SCLS1|nr:predicted protein [Sclerotinia sclerotiorum 1980 UF-70]APA14968.1 hypothetical protein sscle_14g097380 [Sclerotinia sclerotiorum 1980 UF-70]EDN98837.1 predicted protein [Sclerotinia sclerotiorum 1980 UF-70]
MHISSSLLTISTLLTLPLTILADFHYGLVDYTITTATGRYAMILPASQANCTDAYEFYPKGPFGFQAPTGQVQSDICGKEVVLNVTSGSWYTHGRTILEGNCTAVNTTSPTSGVKSPVCIIGYSSGASYTDIWRCPGDVCRSEL